MSTAIAHANARTFTALAATQVERAQKILAGDHPTGAHAHIEAAIRDLEIALRATNSATSARLWHTTPAVRRVALDVLDREGREASTVWRLINTSATTIEITPAQADEVRAELQRWAYTYKTGVSRGTQAACQRAIASLDRAMA